MAIQEGFILQQFGVAVPLQGIAIAGSIGYDMNADFGNGPDPRKVQYPGQTGELVMRVTVATAFVAGQGTPHAQFHILGSESTDTFITDNANDFTVIGSNIGPYDLNTAQTVNGFLAGELAVGNSFFIRFNPWTPDMGRGIADVTSRAISVRDLRYLGLAIVVPEGEGGAEDYFSAGAVVGSLVLQSDIAWDPADFIYPSAFTVT